MSKLLYNGVELPALPNTELPYALIHRWIASGEYFLYMYDTEVTRYSEYSGFGSVAIGYANSKKYRMADGEWAFDTSDNSLIFVKDSNTIVGEIVWTSHPILKEDGTLYLAASDPVPVGSPHITESSGDGFALYNGVKLPNIDTVWTEEMKQSHPYATLSGLKIGEMIFWSLYFSTSKLHTALYEVEDTHCYSSEAGSAVEYAIDSTGEYASSEEWTLLGEREIVADENFGMASMYFWSSYDILNSTDNSVYLAASDPIPLDGMNVIEWDGVTDGLEQLSPYYHAWRVADYIERPARYAVVVSDGDGKLITDVTILPNNTALAWGAIAYEIADVPLMWGLKEPGDIGATPGIYMVKAVHLFAYGDRPTGDGSGTIYDDKWPLEWNSLTVMNNPSYALDDAPIIKVSNLTPTPEEMRSTSHTILLSGELMTCSVAEERVVEGFIDYYYEGPNGGNRLLVSDGSVCESGLYCLNYASYDLDVTFTLTKPDSPTKQVNKTLSFMLGWRVGQQFVLGTEPEDDVIVYLENGILYIKSANGTLNGNILEVK